MPAEVKLPDHLARDLRKMVDNGEYPDMTSAVAELVRLGMQVKKQQRGKKTGGGNIPKGGEQPASSDPHDVNWM